MRHKFQEDQVRSTEVYKEVVGNEDNNINYNYNLYNYNFITLLDCANLSLPLEAIIM